MIDLNEFYNLNSKRYSMKRLSHIFDASVSTLYRWRNNDPKPPKAVIMAINAWAIVEPMLDDIEEGYAVMEDEQKTVRRVAKNRKDTIKYQEALDKGDDVTADEYAQRMEDSRPKIVASSTQLAEIMASVAALRKPKEDEPSFM